MDADRSATSEPNTRHRHRGLGDRPHSETGDSRDADEVRAVIEQWASSVQGRDLEGVRMHHDDEVVMFDVPPPEQGVRGLDAYEAVWPSFFEWISNGARFEIDELHVEADGGLALAWALLRCGTDDDLRSDPARRLRVSFGLRRRGESWDISHEHHSFTHR